MTRLPFIGVTNLSNELSPIMMRLPFIGVKNLNNELCPIMKRLLFIEVKICQQQTVSHNDETTIHLSKQIFSGIDKLTGEEHVAQIKILSLVVMRRNCNNATWK